MAIFSLTKVVLSIGALFLAHRVYYETTTGFRRRALKKKNGCLQVPSRRNNIFPSWLPTFGFDFIIGNYYAIRDNDLLEVWRSDLKAAAPNTIDVSVLGMRIFVTEDPENVKSLLATNFDQWSLGKERIDALSRFLGMGIFTNEGKAWKHSREMLRPCFERSIVGDVDRFDLHTSRFLALLPENGDTVDLQPLLHELTLDVATDLLFGKSTNSLNRGDESEAVKEFIEAFEYCCNPFDCEPRKKYGYIGLFLPDKKEKKSIKNIQEFTDKIIDDEIRHREAVKEGKAEEDVTTSSRYIFLDELITATPDRIAIRSELLNILLAGRDTTASLLSNVLWDLPRHPAILAKLRKEIDNIIGPNPDTIPSYAQLKDMKYLRAIINESQRLYPIVPSNSREALVDTILPRGSGPDGRSPIFVPKGAYVAYHSYSMHRSTALYGADANEFRPERWLEPGFRPGWAYIPFSGGPRVCIGQNFALTEVMFVVVRLVQRFEIEQRDFEEWKEKITVTCTGANGCKVGLKRRTR